MRAYTITTAVSEFEVEHMKLGQLSGIVNLMVNRAVMGILHKAEVA